MFGRGRRRSLVGTAAHTAVAVGAASAISGRSRARREMAAAPEPAAATGRAATEQMAAKDPDSLTEAAGLAANPDVSTALLRLAELKQAGLLTDDEFTAAKARALAA